MHRQYELAPPPSPPRNQRPRSTRSRSSRCLRLPALCPAPRRPPREGFLREDQDYRYDRTADEATGALKDAAAAKRHRGGGRPGITAAAAAARLEERALRISCARRRRRQAHRCSRWPSAAAYSCSRWWVSACGAGSLEARRRSDARSWRTCSLSSRPRLGESSSEKERNERARTYTRQSWLACTSLSIETTATRDRRVPEGSLLM